MKHQACVALAVLLLFSGTRTARSYRRRQIDDRPTLAFGPDGTFKIIQFTDLHYGESDDNDDRSYAFQEAILRFEDDADFVAFSGDMVSGYAWDHSQGWYNRTLSKLLEPVLNSTIPHSVCLGNHDREADLTPEEVMALDASLSAQSLSQPGPTNISGSGNYYIDIMDRSGSTPAARIWFLDTGHTTCHGVDGWGCVEPDTIAWFKQVNSELNPVPSLLFAHIPVQEFRQMWNETEIDVYGEKDEGVCCPHTYSALFEAVKESGINAIYSGHDHDNDYYGIKDSVRLGYGRKSGYGGYGPPAGWQRGARILVLKLGEDTAQTQTYLRLENGDIIRQDLASVARREQMLQASCA